MTETTDVTEPTEVEEVTEAPEAVETAEVVETPEVVETAAAEEPAPRELPQLDRAIQTVGRRKEAVVRVRLTPGTGKFTLDAVSYTHLTLPTILLV